MTNEQRERIDGAVRALVEALRPLPTLDKDSEEFISVDDDRDREVRQACRKVLKRLRVYDASGCPLCLG